MRLGNLEISRIKMVWFFDARFKVSEKNELKWWVTIPGLLITKWKNNE